MKLPISQRLLCCAEMVPPGGRVADVGTDHGYLAVYLVRQGIARSVTATDLRQKPLEKARRNAARFGAADRIGFLQCDGLSGVGPETVDTVVCAGMGGDLIRMILEASPWVKTRGCTLVLQPQSAGQDLRRYLTGNGFEIERETLVRDGGFLYTVLRASPGESAPLTPGEQYATPQLLASGSPLIPEYLGRIEEALRKTAAGLARAEEPQPRKLDYYRQALREITEMRSQYADSR